MDSNCMFTSSYTAPSGDGDGNYTDPGGANVAAAANYSAIQAALHDSNSPDSNKDASKTAAAVHKIRRRNRAIQSCLECRRRKLKCDKQAPCTNCTRFRRDCLYLAPSMDAQSQQKLADMKEKMGALEKNLEREVAAKNRKAHMEGGRVRPEEAPKQADSEDEEEIQVNDEEDGLEPTPLAALDNVYEDNVDDELMDLGVQMGKMRISERIGGWIRPKLVEELNDTLEDVKSSDKSRWSTAPILEDHRNLRPGGGSKLLQASPKSYIGPGPDYIAPASSFFFPGTNMSTSLIDYLPSRSAADQLIEQYWLAVHYMCRTVHRPTFEAQYTLFWGQIATGSEPIPSVQAVIFAAMFSAAVSMTNEQVMQRFGTSKDALIDSLRSGTEMALAKANFLRTTKLDTMQAFVMYMIPLVRAEVSRAHSALVGTAIRLAECMGLHRDGALYNMAPVEIQVRRLIWHQLCFLDMRTSEATGPRPQIRREDYDTKMPLNVDDMDLLDPSNPPTQDKPVWTDMTFARMRAETQEMRRIVWWDIIQIDKKKKSLTSVLVKIQKFRAAMEEQFLPMLDENKPFQALARLVFEMGSKGLYLAVLHRYLFSTSQRMPDRLRQLVIEAGLCQMESSIRFETEVGMQPWTWYRGAFNQYHTALLLLIEVYAFPMRKEASKIWKCLDYIFEIPPHLAPKQKAELVLTDLRDRMEVYHQMRKVRVTAQMEEQIGLRVEALRDVSRRSVVEAVRLAQQDSSATLRDAAVLPPVVFSPTPTVQSDSASVGGGSRQGSTMPAVGVVGDVQMSMMEDIDWAEWEKVFHPDVYTGDLNIPDFKMAEFTGGDFDFNNDDNNHDVSDPNAFHMANAVASQGSRSSFADMSDVNFTPVLFPATKAFRQGQSGDWGSGNY